MGLLIILGFATALLIAVFGHRIAWSERRFVAPDEASGGWTALGRSSIGAASLSSAADRDEALEVWSLAMAIKVRNRFVSATWKEIKSDRHQWAPEVVPHVIMIEQGWPLPLVWGVARSGTAVDYEFGFLPVPAWIPCHLRGEMPILPSISGVAVNTTFWSMLWFALLLLIGTVRRSLRSRRNHCPACNYNLSGLPPASPCPECGNAATTP